MIADDSYMNGSIVSILNISCDLTRYSIHDLLLSGDVSRYDIHDLRSILICITILSRYLCLLVLSCGLCFLRLHARFSVSLVCVGDPDTSVFHEVLS